MSGGSRIINTEGVQGRINVAKFIEVSDKNIISCTRMFISIVSEAAKKEIFKRNQLKTQD
jgi:hypothetical protein